MTRGPVRYVGSPDFHDGYVLDVSTVDGTVVVCVEGDTGIRYVVRFRGVRAVHSLSPDGMMLYALAEGDTEEEGLYRYIFVNWYFDETSEPESKAHLEVVAAGFELERLSG